MGIARVASIAIPTSSEGQSGSASRRINASGSYDTDTRRVAAFTAALLLMQCVSTNCRIRYDNASP